MHLTLYAQPSEAKPYISRGFLKKGKYKEVDVKIGSIAFTDVGKNIYDVMRETYNDVDVEGIDFGISRWIIRIKTKKVKVVLIFEQYKPLSGVEGSCIVMRFRGDKNAIYRIIRKFIKRCDRDIWEMNYWDEFEKNIGIRKNKILEKWEKYKRYKIKEKSEEKKEKKRKKEIIPKRKLKKGKIDCNEEISIYDDKMNYTIMLTHNFSESLKDVFIRVNAEPEMQIESPEKKIGYIKPGEKTKIPFTIEIKADTSFKINYDIEYKFGRKIYKSSSEPKMIDFTAPKIEPCKKNDDFFENEIIKMKEYLVEKTVQIRKDIDYSSLIIDEMKYMGFHVHDVIVEHEWPIISYNIVGTGKTKENDILLTIELKKSGNRMHLKIKCRCIDLITAYSICRKFERML